MSLLFGNSFAFRYELKLGGGKPCCWVPKNSMINMLIKGTTPRGAVLLLFGIEFVMA